jgi:hypothetical protein
MQTNNCTIGREAVEKKGWQADKQGADRQMKRMQTGR